jgi:hypothetical protein
VDSCTTALFDASLNIIPGNKKDILFWSDPWSEGSRLVDKWSDLVTVVPLRRRHKLTLDSALSNSSWIRDICGPLTVSIILQYLDARQCIDHIQLQVEELDRFVWHWTASGQYSSKSAYESLFVGESSILGAKELWKSRAPNKCRFFILLACDRLLKHGLRSDDICPICSQETETSNHLLCQYVFSREIWFKSLWWAGWQHWRRSHSTHSPPGGFTHVNRCLSFVDLHLTPM